MKEYSIEKSLEEATESAKTKYREMIKQTRLGESLLTDSEKRFLLWLSGWDMTVFDSFLSIMGKVNSPEQLTYLSNCIQNWWEEDIHLGYVSEMYFSKHGEIHVKLDFCVTPDSKIKSRSAWDIFPVDSNGFERLADSSNNKKKLHSLIEGRFPSACIKGINIKYHDEHQEYYIDDFGIFIEDYKDATICKGNS